MDSAFTQDKYQDFLNTLPQFLKQGIQHGRLTAVAFEVIEEELSMEKLILLVKTLMESKSLHGINYSLPSSYLEQQESGSSLALAKDFKLLENYLLLLAEDFEKFKDFKSKTIHQMLSDFEEMFIQRILFEGREPYSTESSKYRLKFNVITGQKSKREIIDELKSDFGNFIAPTIKEASLCTPKEFKKYYHPKTIKTVELFKELIG